jgi:predicted dehydrogenase
MILFTWRFMPHVRYLRQLVDAGHVGRVRQMTAHFIGGYAIEPEYQWRFDGNRANGVLGDLGSHLVDLFRHFVGDVTSVSADLQQVVDRSGLPGPRSAPVNDCAFVMLRSADGAQGMLHVSAASPSGDRNVRLGFTLHGDAGVLEAEHIFDGAEKGVRLRGTGAGMPRFEPLEVPAALLDGVAVDDILGPFSRHSAGPRHFIDAIRDDLPIPMSFEDGWRAQAVIDAALRSDRERRWVEVD